MNQDRGAELEPGVPPGGEPDRSHSNCSTLSDRRLSSSSLCSIEEQHRGVYDMVQRILLSTRGYVNFVNEVFRQVSLYVYLLLYFFFKGNVIVMRISSTKAVAQVSGQTRCRSQQCPCSSESFLALVLTIKL